MTQRMLLVFSILIKEHEYWRLEHLEECELDKTTEGYADWVTMKLDNVMRKAGEEFIKANPDLFHTGLV